MIIEDAEICFFFRVFSPSLRCNIALISAWTFEIEVLTAVHHMVLRHTSSVSGQGQKGGKWNTLDHILH